MLIYYEKKIENLDITKQIFNKFGNCEKIGIQHYKNIFDIKVGNYTTEPCIILARQENIAILPTPENYGFPGKSFFFKPSLNCFFQCKYCYLQGTFQNKFPVFFLNYEDMQREIKNKIKYEREGGFNGQITFYASNYADLLATEDISGFHKNFIPFCENLDDDNVLIETRTKSNNINPLIKYIKENPSKQITQKMEIAFSLSPESIANNYEIGTAKLNDKISAINTLLQYGFRVGLRFLPLIPVDNYKNIYSDFLNKITSEINIDKIASITIAPLIFNEGDYKILLKKRAHEFPFLNELHKNEHNLWTCSNEEISDFKEIFTNHFPNSNLLRDYQ